jgi:hypothetical protein
MYLKHFVASEEFSNRLRRSSFQLKAHPAGRFETAGEIPSVIPQMTLRTSMLRGGCADTQNEEIGCCGALTHLTISFHGLSAVRVAQPHGGRVDYGATIRPLNYAENS